MAVANPAAAAVGDALAVVAFGRSPGWAGSVTCWPSAVVRLRPVRRCAKTRWANIAAPRPSGDWLKRSTAGNHCAGSAGSVPVASRSYCASSAAPPRTLCLS